MDLRLLFQNNRSKRRTRASGEHRLRLMLSPNGWPESRTSFSGFMNHELCHHLANPKPNPTATPVKILQLKLRMASGKAKSQIRRSLGDEQSVRSETAIRPSREMVQRGTANPAPWIVLRRKGGFVPMGLGLAWGKMVSLYLHRFRNQQIQRDWGLEGCSFHFSSGGHITAIPPSQTATSTVRDPQETTAGREG